MADISIIARRLPDGRVQYGWSGNGGYCRTVGRTLLTYYNTPEMVEYLFGLGQVSVLARPLNGEYEYNIRFSGVANGFIIISMIGLSLSHRRMEVLNG